MLYIGFVGPKIDGHGFSAISPDFASLIGNAQTPELAIVQLEHAIRRQLELMRHSGFQAPAPMSLAEIKQHDAFGGLVRGENNKVDMIQLCAVEPSAAIH